MEKLKHANPSPWNESFLRQAHTRRAGVRALKAYITDRGPCQCTARWNQNRPSLFVYTHHNRRIYPLNRRFESCVCHADGGSSTKRSSNGTRYIICRSPIWHSISSLSASPLWVVWQSRHLPVELEYEPFEHWSQMVAPAAAVGV